MILRKDVEKLMKEELDRANEKFPLFTSNHEGLSVIEEELFEAETDVRTMRNAFMDLKLLVFKDSPDDATLAMARELTHSALFAAAELIQVAAMGEKFRDSLAARNPEKVSAPTTEKCENPDAEPKKGDPYFTPEEAEKFNIEPPDFLKDILDGKKKDRVIVDVPRKALPSIFEALADHVEKEAEQEESNE